MGAERATRYSVSVRGREVGVTVTPLPNGRALVSVEGGQPVEVELLAEGPQAVLSVAGHVVELSASSQELVARGEHGALRVERQDARARIRPAPRHHSGAVRAPMPGRVVKVLVETGQAVEQGAGVIVIEAMKMENELSAPVSGNVARVHVGAGDTVERDALLVEIA